MAFKVIPFVMLGYPTISDSLNVLAFLTKKKVIVETAYPNPSIKKGLVKTVHQTAIKNGALPIDVNHVFSKSKSVLRTNGKVQSAETKKMFSFFLGKGGQKNKTIFIVHANQVVPLILKTPLVFIACAKTRGKKTKSNKAIDKTLAAVRARTKTPVFAGYGVNAKNMAWFKKQGFNGVFWGTQAVRLQAKGATSFKAFWRKKIQQIIN